MEPEDTWEWPEEQSLSAYYVRNRVVPGEAPAPIPEPKKIPTRPPITDGAGQRDGTQVREYAWSDDLETVKVYVPVPGVLRDKTSVVFYDTSFEVVAETDGFGTHRMAIRKLFDQVDVPRCSYKVLERKEKIIITLRKIDPPGYGTDQWAAHKKWHVLHYGGSGNAEAISGFEKEQMYRMTKMAAGPEMPKLPTGGGKRK
ncbi:hypothetical protein AB1Y20_021314 [Prymnesium parvum]|uniref:CS domain-containing protein n=1 Tax=Prymnesium parvum TaxID=97485 RepID=A0AB34JL64_PRYPA|mmetsp:Transcript_10755/g.25831  ORF Transcript_10755/g.25831 Transcript_10755/m.25831 type:complete len:200 (+) Transcript_10755:97-696(+)|eukprot:CAMPEP_0182802834 /NCGR_PEP_ID=MMETSP0006_2-20121128/3690_1 /TAXON_ID=97485 /ORGANISM="Prymnesium parvum, Strain Texoma1" /LENGTH=199 /DNA_ID=CAMNT_0024928235 /DNA_START=136 /DNA_END=735 /DNA_ORIENTATION=-